MDEPLLPGPVVQIAWFVPDARIAAAHMAATFGAGPFHVIDRIELAWAEIDGEPGDFVHTSAYGQWGDMMMELVHQDSDGPSPFRMMYPAGEQGVHHLAVMVDDQQAAYRHFAEHGHGIAARAETLTGTEFAFIDTVDVLGHMIEVYERSEGLLGFYDFVKQSSIDWDRSDPVRTLGSRSR